MKEYMGMALSNGGTKLLLNREVIVDLGRATCVSFDPSYSQLVVEHKKKQSRYAFSADMWSTLRLWIMTGEK